MISNPSTGGNIALSVSLFNLYNQKNVWYKEFQVEDGKWWKQM